MTVERDEVQRHTILVLTATQVLGGLGYSIGFAVIAVLAERVSGSASLAGLTQTVMVLGAAAGSYALARIMGQRGRRVGLIVGYGSGTVGALLIVVGGASEVFPILLCGGFLLGVTTSATLQSRYAAADLARPERRARDLSIVVWATTVGAVLGPNLSGPAGDLAEVFGLPPLTGPFLVTMVGLLAAGAVVGMLLRPDPLLLARERAGVTHVVPRGTSWGRVRAVLRERPAALAGVLALSSAHAVMIAVMVMTPLHMDHGGADLDIIGLVISVHVLGMFALSPLVGMLADSIGRAPVLVLGGVILLASLYLAGTAPMGASWQIGAGLFLLGLGWSCCTVTGSALLTEASPLDARTDVQGAADLIMNLTAAAAGGLAGVVVDKLGFGELNVFAAILVAGVAVAVVLSRDLSHVGKEPVHRV